MLRHKETPVFPAQLVLVAFLASKSSIQMVVKGLTAYRRDLGWKWWPEVVDSFVQPFCLGGSQAAPWQGERVCKLSGTF